MSTARTRSKSRPRVPTVWIVAGPPGSGKSTLGRAIARATGAMVVDQDVVTNPLMRQLAALVGAGDDLDHPGLRGPVRAARYQCVIDIAVDNRRMGRSVVLIAPFTTEVSDQAAFTAMAAKLAPARVVLIWVTVPSELAMARRRRRNLPRDQATLREADVSTAAVPVRPVVEHLVGDGAADPGPEAARLVTAVGPVGQPPAAPR